MVAIAQIGDRTDLVPIVEWIEPGSSVLDLGCGDGSLLEHLVRHKAVRGMGVDVDLETILRCIEKSIPVLQLDLNEPLDAFPDGSYDYVIVSQTMHQLAHPDRLIADILRIGRRAVVSFPNFGHVVLRLQLLLRGRMPKSRTLPFEWYGTPNIHMSTIADFEEFCLRRGVRILQLGYVTRGRYAPRMRWPNLFSEGCVALLEKAV